jgi:hypothetical protein
MSTKNVVAVLVGLFLLPAAVAHAEGPQPGEPGYVDPQQQQYQQQQYQQQQYQQQPMGDPNAQYQQQQQPVQEQPATEQAQQGRGIEYGGYLFVPIFLTNPTGTDFVTTNPGIGLMGRIGWEFGSGFTAEATIGGQWNSLSVEFAGVTATGSFTNFFVGAGIRYSFLNASALVPFVGAGLQLNFWGVDRTDDGTVSTTNDSLAFGFNGMVGLAYELSADLAIEAGARIDFTTAGSTDGGGTFFDGGQAYLSPFVGATLYY